MKIITELDPKMYYRIDDHVYSKMTNEPIKRYYVKGLGQYPRGTYVSLHGYGTPLPRYYLTDKNITLDINDTSFTL